MQQNITPRQIYDGLVKEKEMLSNHLLDCKSNAPMFRHEVDAIDQWLSCNRAMTLVDLEHARRAFNYKLEMKTALKRTNDDISEVTQRLTYIDFELHKLKHEHKFDYWADVLEGPWIRE